MTPINNSNSSTQNLYAERRRIRADLVEIGEIIAQSRMSDEMTQIIDRWQRNFTSSLSLSGDTDRTIQNFTRQLQEILVDPIDIEHPVPLDEESYLGSDGWTYGSKPLRLYRAAVAAQYLWRSPMDPTNDALFTVSDQPHPIVRRAVRWLRDRGALLQSDRIANAFQQLHNQGTVPPLPTQQVYTRWSRRPRVLAPTNISTPIQNQSSAQNQTLDELETTMRSNAQRFQNEVQSTIQSTNTLLTQTTEQHLQSEQQQLSQLQQRVEASEQYLQEVSEQNDQLKKNLESVQEKLDEVKRAQIQLSIATSEIDQAIADREKRKWGSILKTCAIVGASILGTYLLGGGGGALLPSSKGEGFKIILKL